MVERLARGPASASASLARPLAMSLPAVMQHLQVLEASGLVRSAKAGRAAHLPHPAGGAADVESMARAGGGRAGSAAA